jgi:hypothetical protein
LSKERVHSKNIVLDTVDSSSKGENGRVQQGSKEDGQYEPG